MAERKQLLEIDLPPFSAISESDAHDEAKIRRYLYHGEGITLPGDIELDIHSYYGEPNTPCGWVITIYEQPNTDKA